MTEELKVIEQWALELPDDQFNRIAPRVEVILDEIHPLFFSSDEEENENPVRAAAQYAYGGMILPVYLIEVPEKVRLYLFEFGRKWFVSIDSPTPVPDVFLGIFHSGLVMPSHPQPDIANKFFESYSQNKKKFTVEIFADSNLHSFCFLLARNLGLGFS